MKKLLIICTVMMLSFFKTTPSHAQAEELAQLALDVQKLASLKSVLTNLYNAYKVLTEGYEKVKNVASGNYKLHNLFLDGLYVVNPEIKKYRKIPAIINYQVEIIKASKTALGSFRASGLFTGNQLQVMETTYTSLIENSVKNIDELMMVITDRQLRSSDNERLEAIDRIFNDIESKALFLRDFNAKSKLLMLQKQQQASENEFIKRLHQR